MPDDSLETRTSLAPFHPPTDTDRDIPSDIPHAAVIETKPDPLPAAVSTTPLPQLILVTLLTGVAGGIGGMGLALLLHFIQHIAYGYSLHAVISDENFLAGVTAAPPWRRFLVLLGAGLIAGFGWWAMHRFGRPLVSIKKAVTEGAPPMPMGTTIAHALLQIVTVALGSPLGREVAPREIGAVLAGWCCRRLGLTVEDTRLMVACGAGAGLAAVYNVPLSGAVFVLEVLLMTVRPRVVIVALATSVIGTVIAWIGLGTDWQYQFPHYPVSTGLMVWACLMGPVAGVAGLFYSELTAWARSRAPKNARIIVTTLAAFALVGLLTAWLPQLPGNGKGPIQLALSGAEGPGSAVLMLAVKLVAVIACLLAGAEGGLLTPGLAIGSLLSVPLGEVWNAAFQTGIPLGAFVIVGATAFLAVSMRMPVTAILLLMEFTRAGQDFLIPMIAATAGAMAVREGLARNPRGLMGRIGGCLFSRTMLNNAGMTQIKTLPQVKQL
ncbi:chloride channel protein [Acidisoma cellulosilytica]|uniref:Chloride channel protein n=1 Tax=Acidisoma cellulosilyticum TaxID=2802395 RepID=A0A963YZ38_9PROT|nr:chloride channel protein [Acidisoma cellulosilyticum]MCB8879566.1 chloride channel protein [Acidisoma cellulosilyticum]